MTILLRGAAGLTAAMCALTAAAGVLSEIYRAPDGA
jgi:hypothetical protein